MNIMQYCIIVLGFNIARIIMKTTNYNHLRSKRRSTTSLLPSKRRALQGHSKPPEKNFSAKALLQPSINVDIFWSIFAHTGVQNTYGIGSRKVYVKKLVESLRILALDAVKDDAFYGAVSVLCAIIDIEIDKRGSDLSTLSQIVWGLSRPILCNIAEDGIGKRKLISIIAHMLIVRLIITGGIVADMESDFSAVTGKSRESIIAKLRQNIFSRCDNAKRFLEVLDELAFGAFNIRCFDRVTDQFYSLVDAEVRAERYKGNFFPALIWEMFSAIYSSTQNTIDKKKTISSGAKRMLNLIVANTT